MTTLIPDINLRILVNDYLSKPYNSNLTYTDLENITEYLYTDNSSTGNYISSLEGLQYAINMTELLIENNLIIDITPITNLDKLNTLFLNNNIIRNIPDLSNMTSLTSLLLNNNEIKDVSMISTAKNLRFVKVNNNMICDLSPLSQLSSLCELKAVDQEILIKDVRNTTSTYTLDISFLKDLYGNTPSIIQPSHYGRYDAQSNKILWLHSVISSQNPSFSFSTEDGNFSGKVTIQIIDLDKSILIDDKNLESEILKTLNSPSDIVTNKDMLRLRVLDLTSKNINCLKGLEYAQNLYTLKLDKTPITNLKYIPTSVSYISAKNLKNEVQISDVRLKLLISLALKKAEDDVITINDIKSLTILDEPNSHLNSIEGLEVAENLKILSLVHNNISDITPLNKLENLTYLDLSQNSISDLSPLSNTHQKIKYIYAYNQVINLQLVCVNNDNFYILSLDFLKDINGKPIKNITPSDDGIFNIDSNTITYPIKNTPSNVSFIFSDNQNIFNGVVNIEII